MKKWIVTGYSSKNDGLLFVVEAETKEAAIRKVGDINRTIFKSVEIPSSPVRVTLNDVGEYKFANSGVRYVLCTEEMSEEYLKGCLEENEPRHFWEMWAEELRLDSCHKKAVCW